MSYVFTGDSWGEKVPGLYESALKDSEMVLRTWTSNMTGPLTNHHVYEYAGGLSLAIESVSGKQPTLMLNDVRDKPRIRDFQEVLTTEAHATMLNPKWIRGMMENGYSGAGMMAEVVRNASGWQATRRGSISQVMWDDIHAVYVKDKHRLGVRDWMNQANPHARQEILATMLEAARKGDWQADEETRRELARDYASSVAQHGDSGGLATGGNKKLQTEVLALLDAPADPDLAALGKSYNAALRQSETAPPPPTPTAADTAPDEPTPAKTEVVTGNELTPEEPRSSPRADPSAGWNWTGGAVAAAALVFLCLGALRSKGGV
jgi:cobaltochelatase CobN